MGLHEFNPNNPVSIKIGGLVSELHEEIARQGGNTFAWQDEIARLSSNEAANIEARRSIIRLLCMRAVGAALMFAALIYLIGSRSDAPSRHLAKIIMASIIPVFVVYGSAILLVPTSWVDPSSPRSRIRAWLHSLTSCFAHYPSAEPFDAIFNEMTERERVQGICQRVGKVAYLRGHSSQQSLQIANRLSKFRETLVVVDLVACAPALVALLTTAL